MNFKNIITNIFGLTLWAFALKEINEKETNLYEVGLYVVLGIALFLFENKKLQDLAHKGIDTFIKKKGE